ncbi:hypothetical protein [Calycomorphotria hydatis]|uniref:Uncharacterized protein n=1 Tax=Calycomorphotria hydatis TaxID=2528027 RepID=A0A517TEC6_9PLAN|nr:hypothetical protein [Calycomorphotria hydatis]QDT66730.1 hypothetical protein V22_40010 [Calycomorphotria hydatis]
MHQERSPTFLLLFPCYFAFIACACSILAIAFQTQLGDLLQQQSGVSLAIILESFPKILWRTCAAAIAAALATFCLRHQIDAYLFVPQPVTGCSRIDEFSCQSVGSKPLWALVFIATVVLVIDGISIADGYFESDDFDLLVANRVIPLPDLLFTTHNDHSIPLLRAEFHVMQRCFGTNATVYNAAVLTSFTLMLFSGYLLLTEIGTSRSSILLFLIGCIGWTLWGEFTTGEYILQKYMQITTSGLLASWSAIRWQRTHNWKYAIFSMVIVLFAGLMNVSGLWVPCAWVVFSTLTYYGDTNKPATWPLLRKSWLPLTLVVMSCSITLLVHTYVYTRPTNEALFTEAKEPLTAVSFLQQSFYLPGSLILSIPIPTPHHLSDFGLLIVSLFAVWITSFLLIAFCLKQMDRLHRSALISVLFVILGISSMTCLGRPSSGIGYYVAAKYLGPMHVWVWMAIALCWQAGWDSVSIPKRPLYTKTTIVLVLSLWIAHFIASSLGSAGSQFFETTRGGKLREHRRERHALSELRRYVISPLEQEITGKIIIPDIPGEVLGSKYPKLAYTWGELRPLSTFIDVLSENPQRIQLISDKAPPLPLGVSHVPSVCDEVSPEIPTLLTENLLLKELIEATHPLKCVHVKDTTGSHSSKQRSN